MISLLAVPPAYTLPPALLRKAKALESLHTLLYFGGTAWDLLVVGLLLRWRAGAKIARWAERLTARPGSSPYARRPWLAGLLVAPAWLLILLLIDLPGDLVSHRIQLRYGLSIERWPAWWLDFAKEGLGSLLIGTLLLSVVFALLRRSPRRWWLWTWALVQPVVILGVFLSPVLIDPLFNHFTPLLKQDPALVARLEKVAQLGHLAIPPDRIFVEDASRRETGMNAYVTGVGRSKRIVVWDTTLQRVPPDEILAIYAHEQGHYVLGHIWKGILFAAVLMFFLFALLAWLFERAVQRFGGRWHIASSSEWSALPLLLLLSSVIAFLSAPISNAVSRSEEHAADVYGQQLLMRLLPHAASIEVADFNRLGRAWLEDPTPNRFVVWWTYTHPPTADRAEEAARMAQR